MVSDQPIANRISINAAEQDDRIDSANRAEIKRRVKLELKPSSDNPHEQAMVESRRAPEALRKKREVAKQQSDFLESYSKTLDSKSADIGGVERFLDMFAPRQLAVAKRVQEFDAHIERAEREYADAQAKVRADARGAKRDTKITVTVLAEVDGHS
ncbi:hypothetical protein FRC10_005365 [Ceratobasidium sp. 414]|nr:hypothetical protein FRC10_005365 [Ceratobasidium sp. 414]